MKYLSDILLTKGAGLIIEDSGDQASIRIDSTRVNLVTPTARDFVVSPEGVEAVRVKNTTYGLVLSTHTAPNSNNTYDIGSSSLRFRAAYFVTGDFSGQVTATSLVINTGNVTINSLTTGAAGQPFVIANAGVLYSRTPAQAASDIGAAASGVTWSGIASGVVVNSTSSGTYNLLFHGGSNLVFQKSGFNVDTATNTITGNITGTAGSETLATVTGRGATTSTAVIFNGGLSSTTGLYSSTLKTDTYLSVGSLNTPIYSEQLTVGVFNTPKITYAQSGGYRWSTYVDNLGDAKFRIRYEEGSLDAYIIDRLGNNTWTGTGSFGGKLSWGTGTYSAGISSIYNTSDDGTVFLAKTGTARDFLMTNGVGASVFSIPTGTNNVSFLGRIFTVDNIGVGTTSVSGSYRLTLNGDATTNTGGIVIRQNGIDVFYIGNITATNTVDFELWNPRNGLLRFGTNNLIRYTINASGNHNFGSGTATFGATLTGTSATFSGTVSTTNLFRFTNTGSNFGSIYGSSNEGYVIIAGGNSDAQADGGAIILVGSDRGGVNTRGEISLRAGGSGAGSFINFFTGGSSERMRLTSAGRLLLNTTTDNGTDALQVAGSGLFTGSFSNAYALSAFNTNTTAGTSFGAFIRGGTNASDYALNVNNAANTVTLFQVTGNGIATLANYALINATSGTGERIFLLRNSSGGTAAMYLTGTSTSTNYVFDTYSTGNAFVIKNDGTIRFKFEPQTSYLGSYSHIVAGGYGVMYRDAYDSYITSNMQWRSDGALIAKYTTVEGMGYLALTGKVIQWVTRDGSVTAGSDYSMSTKFSVDGAGNVFSVPLSGSGNVIVYANNGGGLGKMVIGSGLSFDGTTLTATGGSAGTVTGSGTSGTIPLWNSASDIGNSVMTQSSGNITTTGSFITGTWFQAPNNYGLSIRNAANSAYRTALYLDASDHLIIGADTDIATVRIGTASATSALSIASGGSATFSSSVTASSFSGAGTGLTGTASGLSIGGNAATATGWGGSGSPYQFTYSTMASINTYMMALSPSGDWRAATAGNVQSFLGLGSAAYTASSAYYASGSNVVSATIASTVTINYNDNSNSTYQMLWGSGNSVYGTAGIYCNPFTDIVYTRGLVVEGDNNAIGLTNQGYGIGWFAAANSATQYSNASLAGDLVIAKRQTTGYSAARMILSNQNNGIIAFAFGTNVFPLDDTIKAYIDTTGRIYASKFTETSDRDYKKEILSSVSIDGIEKIKAKLYEKSGDVELGYYAQDAQPIIPFAVTKNIFGKLNLSYREVLVGKVQRLENRDDEKDKIIQDLSSRLRDAEKEIEKLKTSNTI